MWALVTHQLLSLCALEAKMNCDLTDITLVVDRSASMDEIREDAEGGVNAFIRNQAALPGEANITLVQFDTEYEFVDRGVPASKMKPYKLKPRGCTALLDAVGRAINETGQRLSGMSEAQRPGLVVFVVMTDGLENSSKEFTKPQIKQMIEEQTNNYQWKFTFLGADQDAFGEASAMGMDAAGAADFSKDKVGVAYMHAGSKVGRMRRQARAGQQVDNAFTAEERQSMK
jgi:hypothetical protein